MFDVFLAELLILLLIFLVTLRIFFTKNARIDSTVIFAPVAFVFSLLLLYVWGADLFILILCVLSLVTFVLNIRSLMRLSARLIVDHYNLRFVIPMILIALASLAVLVFLVIFRPVRYKPSDFGVVKTKVALTGNLASGYAVRETLFEPSNISGVLYAYETASTAPDQSQPVILFLPKLTANAMYYEPYFLMLAQKGYRVLSADYNAADRRLFSHDLLNTRLFRRFYSVCLSRFAPDAFEQVAAEDAAYQLRGYAELSKLALKRFGTDTPLYYAVEHINLESLNELTTTFGENALGFFALNRVTEFKSIGYGCLEQSEPFLAHFFGVERDPSFFIPRYVASKTIASIAEAQKLAAPVEIIKGE